MQGQLWKPFGAAPLHDWPGIWHTPASVVGLPIWQYTHDSGMPMHWAQLATVPMPHANMPPASCEDTSGPLSAGGGATSGIIIEPSGGGITS